jgi:formylglycine-generating enzyme required for sulfatase activity
MHSTHKEREERLWKMLLGRDSECRQEASRTARALDMETWFGRKILAELPGWHGRQRADAGSALALLGDPRFSGPHYLPEMIGVPAGIVTMGSHRCPEERPVHELSVAAFALAQYPVTQAAYAVFVDVTGYRSPRGWPRRRPSPERANAPVVCVSARDAEAYCQWLGDETGCGYRLPTEAEWMMAACGPADSRVYPWGSSFDDHRANAWGRHPIGHVCAVGLFPEGRGPFGHYDLAGNVWEWCSSLYRPYPFQTDDGREDAASDEPRVMHGGSWRSRPISLRCAARQGEPPTDSFEVVGFRIARNG